MAKANGINVQVVAGRVKSLKRREVRDKTLTSLWIEGYSFSVLVWNDDVEAKEGDFVFAEGRVQSRSYEKDGEKRYVTEVIAHRVTNLSAGKAGNAVFAIGNLGKDPRMRYTPSGKAVTNVSMAANAYGAESPEWMNLTAWERVAEVINQYLHRGNRIAVVGRLIKSTWQGKGENTGKTFHRTKLVVGDMLMLGRANGNGSGYDDVPPGYDDEEQDEIPF